MKTRVRTLNILMAVLLLSYIVVFVFCATEYNACISSSSSILHTYIIVESDMNPWLFIWFLPIELLTCALLIPWLINNKIFSALAVAAYTFDIGCLFYCLTNDIFESFIVYLHDKHNFVIYEVMWPITLLFDIVFILLFVYRMIGFPMRLPKEPKKKRLHFLDGERLSVNEESKTFNTIK